MAEVLQKLYAGMTAEDLGMALASANYFTKTFLRNPLNPKYSYNPQEFQEDFCDIVDFGYPLTKQRDDIINLKPTHPVTKVVLLSPRQYGKTAAVITLCTSLIARYPNTKIGIVSNRADNAEELLELMTRYIIDIFGDDFVVSKRLDKLITKNNVTVYSYGPTESIRGKSLTWVFVDECAQIPEPTLVGAAYPTVDMAGIHLCSKCPSIILTSTPRGRDNKFTDEYIKGLELREVGCTICGNKRSVSHEDFKGITFNEWSVPDDVGICPDCGNNKYRFVSNDIASIRVDPYKHMFKTPDQIDREIDLEGNTPLVRQEKLGEIINDDLGAFKREWLVTCTNKKLNNKPYPKKDIRYVLGGDFGKSYDATVFSIGHKSYPANKSVLDHIFRMAGGMDYKDIRYEFLRLVSIFRPYLVVLDSTGLGDPVVEQILDDLQDLRVSGVAGFYVKNKTRVYYKFEAIFDLDTEIYCNLPKRLGYVFTYESKQKLINNLKNIISMGYAEIPFEFYDNTITLLWKELIRFGFKFTDNGRIKYGTQREHDDCVISYALLLWGLRQQSYTYLAPSFGGSDNFVL